MEKMEETIRKQEESFKDLTNLNVRGSIDLATFSRNFFPMFIEYFAGKLEPNLNFWFSATGTNGYQPVDVLESNGEVVFSVPPVFESKSNHAKSRNEIGPAEHMAIVQMKDNVIPGSGTSHANEVFKQIGQSEIPDSGQIREFFDSWIKILNYYGYESENNTTSNSSNINDTLTEDDIDGYEDL